MWLKRCCAMAAIVLLLFSVSLQPCYAEATDTGSPLYLYTKAGTRYTFSCSSFAIPRYRLADSSGYSYTDLYLSVTGSNLQVATDFPPAVPFSDSYPLIMLGVMGVMILCLMRYRH